MHARLDRELWHAALLNALVYVATAEYPDPLTFCKAMELALANEWKEACAYKIDTLAKNGTWMLVELPPGCKAVKSKWVFKHKADGHFHAHLVAKGFMQIFGIDYNEMFSPVAQFESLQLLLALAMLEDWEIHQMDIKSAFFNGLLDKEIYMKQPQGFIDLDHPHKVCLLKKVIYRLKQALHAWNLLHLGLISVSHVYLFVHLSCFLYHMYYWPAFSASTGLTLDLAVILILSSYIPIMHSITHFPFLCRHSHMYVSFLLMTLPDSSPLYTSHVTHCSTY
jgi:hypothetical protein